MGNVIPPNIVTVQIAVQAVWHSIPKELISIWNPRSPIAVKPGIKIPTAENMRVGFNKSAFLIVNFDSTIV